MRISALILSLVLSASASRVVGRNYRRDVNEQASTEADNPKGGKGGKERVAAQPPPPGKGPPWGAGPPPWVKEGKDLRASVSMGFTKGISSGSIKC
jgi:hypothetical protein